MKTLKAAFLVILMSVPAGALELSLEENRAERGNIGYIDMQRLFKTFPETLRAKESFEEVVRQAEEQMNLRKAEILRLRNDLSTLKIEREFIARTPYIVLASTAAAKPPPAPAPLVLVSTAIPGAPEPAVLLSTAARRQEPLVINIPGVSTGPIVVLPPAAAVSPSTAAPSLSLSTGAATLMPAVSTAPATNPALMELDSKIAAKARELAQKEADFKELQASTERNLLDLESRKTEILLGKIHAAVQEVARKEGVSVVVDKSSIVFGHDAVDLTEKVLKRLKAP